MLTRNVHNILILVLNMHADIHIKFLYTHPYEISENSRELNFNDILIRTLMLKLIYGR